MNVSVFVQELHDLLHTVQAALNATENHLSELTLGFLGLILKVGDHSSHCLDDGDDEGAVSSGTQMEEERLQGNEEENKPLKEK